MTYLSPAKINLFLHITSKRDDGYHNLQTIFQLLDFYDEIDFSLRNDGKINRTSGNEDILISDDLMIKSAKKLKQYSPYKGVSTHSFRRSCLTALNRAKVPLNVIASLSGHSSMNSLRLYLGIDEKEQIEAINLL